MSGRRRIRLFLLSLLPLALLPLALLPLALALALTLVLAPAACSDEEAASNDQAAMARACHFLWSKLGDDGGWHSEHYGLLRSGQSLTAFVLATLLEVPADVATLDAAGVNRAVEFLARNVNEDGALGLTDGEQDYPNYASAMAFGALQSARLRLTNGGREQVESKLRRYLVGQQFREELGWQRTDPAFGGWGMGGAPQRGPGTGGDADPGHVDLSMTRVVLQALARFPTPPTEELNRALAFLDKCTSSDGGFFFSPVVLGANKGGPSPVGIAAGGTAAGGTAPGGTVPTGKAFASYGSATADGILALLAIGVPQTDTRVRRASELLVARHRTDRVPGIPEDMPTRWAYALRFYYLAVSAESFSRLGVQEAPVGHDWRADVHAALIACQSPDGSWRNAEGQVKEDDPLIATALALRALTAARNP